MWKIAQKKSRAKKHLLAAGRPRPDHCEVCGYKPAEGGRGLHFDHCHETGKFRGWLCNWCNLALGHVKDDPARLRALISYLETFG